MPWTFTNLVIAIIAGILGGHAAAAASREHSFGALGHTVTGAAGGALSGTLIQAVTGAVVGGICTLLVGFIKRSIDEHKSSGR